MPKFPKLRALTMDPEGLGSLLFMVEVLHDLMHQNPRNYDSIAHIYIYIHISYIYMHVLIYI